MKHIIKNLFVFSLALFVGFGLAFSEEKSPNLLTMDTYMQMESIRGPDISPDGRFILFSRGWINQMEDRSQSNLWMTDIEGQRVRQFTRGDWRDSSPVWSPDGSRVAFLSDRGGSSQVYVMWMDTRDVAQLTNLADSPGGLTWSPDGTKLAFTMFHRDESPALKVRLPERPRGAKWAPPAIIIDRLSWRRDGRGPVPKGYSHIYVMDAKLGGTPRKITSGDYSHSGPAWSADGRTIYFSAIRKPDAEYEFGDSEIYAVDLGTLEIKALTDREGPDHGPVISPDGKWIAYTGYDDRNFTSHLSNLYLMDSNGGSKKMLAGGLPSSPSGLIWAPDGKGLYYQMAEKGVCNLCFVSTGGKITEITEGNHYLSSVSLSKNGQAAAVLADYSNPGTLVTFSLKQPPLTHTAAETASGAESSLTLRVNGVAWDEAPSLYGLAPEAKSYIIRLDDEDRVTITFGDGKMGARLPTGQENISATYRTGIGLEGVGPTDAPYDLEPGDYLRYPGDAPHVFEALESATSAVLISEMR